MGADWPSVSDHHAVITVGVRAIFFWGEGGAEPSLPEKISTTAPEKNCYAACKNTLPDSPHPIFNGKNFRFRAFHNHIAGRNEFRFFCLISTKRTFFSFLAAGFCRKNLGFARKIMALSD